MLIVRELRSLDVATEVELVLELLYGVVDCDVFDVASSIGTPLEVGSGSGGGLAANALAALSASARPPARNMGECLRDVFMACSCSMEK